MAVTASGVKKFVDGKIIGLWEEIADLRAVSDKPNKADVDALEEKIEIYQEMREQFLGDRLENAGEDEELDDDPEEEEDEPRRYRKRSK